MLQIRCLFFLFLCFFVYSFATDALKGIHIEWVLETALEEELVNLDTSGIITPHDFKNAIEFYKDKKYRQASAILADLIKLNLPDGQLDFISFMAGECYRKLKMNDNAKEAYTFIIKNFPESDKIPAVYFRLLQYAYEDRESDSVDSLIIRFEEKYKMHPLYNSVLYVGGKLYFQTERFGEAVDILSKVPKNSSRYFQAQFVAALSLIMLNDIEKSIETLKYILLKCLDEDIVADANVLLGDVFFKKEKYESALPYYQAVSKEREKYHYAQVKIAIIFLKTGQYNNATNVVKPFLSKGRKSGYFFEMASILEQIYNKTNEKEKMDKINKLIQKQNIYASISFEINEELVKVYDIIRMWKNIEHKALHKSDENLLRLAQKNINQLEKLKIKFRKLLYDIGALKQRNIDTEVPGLAQQRYITLLRKQIATVVDSIAKTENELKVISISPTSKDSILDGKIKKQKKYLDNSRIMLASMQEEYKILKKEFIESGKNADKFGIEIQAKYVDWSFMKYIDKKKQLENINEQISQINKETTFLSDSTLHYLILSRDKLTISITDDRKRLKEHIDLLLDANPKGSYSPQIQFRLSELFYDEAVDDFSVRLDEYERLRESGGDSTELEFPEYNLDKVITLYDNIITQYPDDLIADDALFYKAHALKKLGLDDKANKDFENLIERYPESEYYIEANMNIGSYYFSNTTLEDNSGLKLAEEAYRRVLAYRDHPQFVHAIYHLGWCYYMQDQYENAISVFKYLVEEVDLDFSISKAENTQVLNPLMREEAIDYIAISFDERNDLDGALKFLSLVGDIDYAALVFKRIGELREEDLDFTAAIDVYKRLIDAYPLSSIAPGALENLIKVYESNNNPSEALKMRELFFKRFSRGSKWYEYTKKNNPEKIAVVDSMSIANGLYVADDLYRQAEKNGRREDYLRAMKNYERLVKTYPDIPSAAEALWNLAIISDSKLNEQDKAYSTYINYSRFEKASDERREQAALNAIALVQKMVASDTGAHTGNINPHTSRMIQATENYILLFPNGKSYTEAVMNMGSIYFNNKQYNEAISTYQIITKRGKSEPKFYNAGFLISKCFFGKEDWPKAAGGFEKVWKEASDEFLRQEAFKLLLQSKFLSAEKLLDSGDYNKAAIEYRNIDRKYPGSEYGDISLFNSAEAFEKLEDWLQSCRVYFELHQKYPLSKLAPDALFNAATNYEKIKRYNKSAEMYELIVKKYPNSLKAKDALFNVGFSYEKLGKFDKLAESNELYSKLYPGEKDVELMLFRSAEFYFKSSNFQKSITLYKNYIARYPNSSRTVEAYYKIGTCYYKNNDLVNTIMAYNQAEERNKRILSTGSKGDDYFAAEAAFALAKIKQRQCFAITFDNDIKNLKDKQEEKTGLLSQAVNAFQKVMKYKSEKMFEAAFRIGEMYEEYAYTWSRQKLDIKDPIKLAVAKKDINFASATLMKKAFEPFKKVIELGANIGNIVSAQHQWIDSAKIKLSNNSIVVGDFMINGVSAMQKSPVPLNIKENLLYLFQYRKQLLETLEPLKIESRDFFLGMYKELEKQKIKDKNFEDCYNKFGQINYLIPSEFEKLSEQILTSMDNIPKNLSEAEKEELIFQFEDIVFELQDKALFGYEDALALTQKENQTETKWHKRILQRLARLSPETYGKNFYLEETFQTDLDWITHSDSVRYWNAADPFGEGWQQVKVVSQGEALKFTAGNPRVIWGNKEVNRIYLWKNAFLNGIPRRGKIYFACNGKYRIFLNEKLLSIDTSDNRSLHEIDSISGIEKLLKGGDNILAIEITGNDSLKRGFALVLNTMIDTSEHFKTVAMEPKVKKIFPIQKTEPGAAVKILEVKKDSVSTKSGQYTEQFKNKAELLKVISDLYKKTALDESKIRKERINVQKLNIKLDAMDSRISKVLKEIEELKKRNNQDNM